MKGNRRSFLKKAALGSAAISTVAGLSIPGTGPAILPEAERENRADPVQDWQISFDESLSRFSFRNETVSLQGRIEFLSGNQRWAIVKSRDGVPDRYALADPQGNVQGYIVTKYESRSLKLLFYHRTAQAYNGILSFQGVITFPSGGFACRTKPDRDERVLSLFYGPADSLLNDSVFDPETDTLFRLNAADLQIRNAGHGSFEFRMSGRIEESSEAIFSFCLGKGYFRNSYIPYYHAIDRKRAPEAPTGWMSWNTYFDRATADDNLAEARIGKKYLQPFGCQIWHIESWQENSDTLPVSKFHNMNLETSRKKFPKGMKKLAGDIRNLGFRPGLWVAPFGTGNEEFYRSHKEWFLHDKAGKPVSCWNGRYTLDPTVGAAREHLKSIFRTASREWGYEYFKIDGMSGRNHGYCAHLYERPEIRELFRDPSCPNPFELCLRAFREGIGEDRILLACQGHTSGPDVMYSDASRIGADIVHPNEPVKWTGVLNQGRCFMNQAFAHNIVTYADPDTLLVRDLNIEEARTSATVVALPGQLTFFGDKLEGLPADRMKLLQQTLPPAKVRPSSLYPYFTMLPVWNLHVKNRILGDYNIVALFNWEDEKKRVPFSVKELGIDPDAEYSLFEFWTQKDLGTVRDRFEMEVPEHGVRLVALHPVKNYPHWVSSDRHIAQTGIEVIGSDWKNVDKTLEGEINLVGTFPLTMNIYVPAEFQFDRVEGNGFISSSKMISANILAVTFLSKTSGNYIFNIRFMS